MNIFKVIAKKLKPIEQNSARIEKVVELYPLSLSDCAKILEIIAPLTEVLDADGICKFLQDIVDIRCGDYAMNLLRVIYILKKYKIAEDEDKKKGGGF